MRVLIVEDYAPIRESVARGLREAGYAVDVAADGEDGLWLATGNDYDVIVLDLMLPKRDGMSVLDALNQSGRSSRVLLLTAKDRVEDRVNGLDAGADDYLTKPFAFAELLARVRTLVRRRYAATTPVLRIGDLEIDTVRRGATRSGDVLELTPREFTLLEYLANRADEVVTRTEIWEHLYDFQTDSQSNVVDVYVGYLRKKLEEHGRSRLIHTRRGHGYQLSEACQ